MKMSELRSRSVEVSILQSRSTSPIGCASSGALCFNHARTCAWLKHKAPELAQPIGEVDLDWRIDTSTDRLRNSLIFIQQTCRGDLDRLTELTVEILMDILALRQSLTAEEVLV